MARIISIVLSVNVERSHATKDDQLALRVAEGCTKQKGTLGKKQSEAESSMSFTASLRASRCVVSIQSLFGALGFTRFGDEFPHVKKEEEDVDGSV